MFDNKQLRNKSSLKGKAKFFLSRLFLSLSIFSLSMIFNDFQWQASANLTFTFSDDKTGTLDGALDNLYCRSQMYVSRQMSRLRPELTMPIFSGLWFKYFLVLCLTFIWICTEMTHRFQKARTDVRFLLLQSLLPWLENMELLASSVPATVSPLSYIMYYPDSGMKGRKDGSGSTEATEMILNNLFYITAKVLFRLKYLITGWEC